MPLSVGDKFPEDVKFEYVALQCFADPGNWEHAAGQCTANM